MISKNSIRIQFTLNSNKQKEKQIIDFLDSYMNPNSIIKEILLNYIVSNSNSQLLKVAHLENVQSESELVEVSKSEQLNNNIGNKSEQKSPEVSNELELNELEELKKFVT